VLGICKILRIIPRANDKRIKQRLSQDIAADDLRPPHHDELRSQTGGFGVWGYPVDLQGCACSSSNGETLRLGGFEHA
jgi:hypothetical protein